MRVGCIGLVPLKDSGGIEEDTFRVLRILLYPEVGLELGTRDSKFET